MSTASGLMLLMEAHQRHVDELMRPFREAVDSMIIAYARRIAWRCHLEDAAEATRYQLTWNGK